MILTLRHAAQRKLATWLATMPRDRIAYASIDGAALDLRFGHCRAPHGIA
jgi:hypothetical protein